MVIIGSAEMFKKVRKKFKSLQPFNLDNTFSDFGTCLHNPDKSLFLRRYSKKDIEKKMKKVRFIHHLKSLGFDDISITTEMDDACVHYLKVYNKEQKPDNLLFDLRVSESRFVPDKSFFKNEKDVIVYDMIVIEWMASQNPYINFNSEKPQLPGQKYPGLGILKYCFNMMYDTAKEISRDGFLDIPDHGHGAVMYSKKFKFFNPKHEAILRAVLRDLKKHKLSDISWGFITNTIIDERKNLPLIYDPSEQVFAVSHRMKQYFSSALYKKTFQDYYKKRKYHLNIDEMKEKRKEILLKKNIIDL